MPASSLPAVAEPNRHPIVVALDERSDAIASLLPRGADIERFKRIVLQSINRNPDLRKCSPNSVVDAAAEAARLGLEPSGAIGGAHLVPYGTTAQLIVDYRGLVELARRSGEIAAIDAAVVRQADTFYVRRGTEPAIEHEPDLHASSPADPTDEGNPVTHVYAVARLRNGERQFDVMTLEEIERIRTRSRAGNKGPWRTDWHEMAKKTVLRRLSKTLPLSVEVRALLEMEDSAERAPAAVVSRTSADRLGGLRQTLHSRAEALDAAEPEEVVQATVADATKPTPRSRKPEPAEKAEEKPAEPELTLEEATGAFYEAAIAGGLVPGKDPDADWTALDAEASRVAGQEAGKLGAAEWQALAAKLKAEEWPAADEEEASL